VHLLKLESLDSEGKPSKGPLISCFTLVHIPRQDGSQDPYWHRIEILEDKIFQTDQHEGDMKFHLRARIILPRGLRQLTNTEMTNLLMGAFNNYKEDSGGLGTTYEVTEDVAVEDFKNLDHLDLKQKQRRYFHGYLFKIKQAPDEILFRLEKLPPYGSPATAELDLVASYIKRGKKVELTQCRPKDIASGLKINWENRKKLGPNGTELPRET
jgi:hypothetical protein